MYRDYNYRPELVAFLKSLHEVIDAGLADYFTHDLNDLIDDILEYKEDPKDMYIDHEIKDRE